MRFTLILCLSLLASSARPGVLINGAYVITNPTPSVTLAWNAPTIGTPVGYNLYQGIASRIYTNMVPAIGSTSWTFVYNPNLRGVKCFFAVTAFDANGLESVFSNEVTNTPSALPGAPSQLPPVTLVVQESKKVTGPFVDTAMVWGLDPANTNDYFRLRIDKSAPVLAAVPMPAVRPTMKRVAPPMPGQ